MNYGFVTMFYNWFTCISSAGKMSKAHPGNMIMQAQITHLGDDK